jgi:hypothetical protein
MRPVPTGATPPRPAGCLTIQRSSRKKFLAPHQAATLQRIQAQPVVLVVQDTTELDLTTHPPADAGCLNRSNRFGLYDHTCLTLTPQRICLGVVGQQQFDRAPESLGKTRERTHCLVESKDSRRWLVGYRKACELAAAGPKTQIVSVADSEGDLYDILSRPSSTRRRPTISTAPR